jgi:hypothetical protein
MSDIYLKTIKEDEYSLYFILKGLYIRNFNDTVFKKGDIVKIKWEKYGLDLKVTNYNKIISNYVLFKNFEYWIKTTSSKNCNLNFYKEISTYNNLVKQNKKFKLFYRKIKLQKINI